MRPPLNAGENNRSHERVPIRGEVASMRPPLNAGENIEIPTGPARSTSHAIASMRPPLNAGENADARRRPAPRRRCRFNEAPAERGGKQDAGDGCRPASLRRFNEAPAERGGKRRDTIHGATPVQHQRIASMRPPLNAGENSIERRCFERHRRASKLQ